jgi:quinol monooxygenase YgiN
VHARSTTIRGRPESVEDGIAFCRDDVLPMCREMPGCVGLSLIADRETGRCIVTTSWDSIESMRATTEQVQPIRQRVAEILGGTPEVAEWEIAVMHRDHQAGDGSFCRSTWLATEPSNADRALDIYRMAVLPKIEELEGFCSASMLIDRATGMAVGTVAFDSREALDASRAMAEGIRAAASKDIGAQILDVHEYELALAHLHVPEMA